MNGNGSRCRGYRLRWAAPGSLADELQRVEEDLPVLVLDVAGLEFDDSIADEEDQTDHHALVLEGDLIFDPGVVSQGGLLLAVELPFGQIDALLDHGCEDFLRGAARLLELTFRPSLDSDVKASVLCRVRLNG